MREERVQKTIAQVQEEYQAAQLPMLPEFICVYQKDARAGIQKIVQKARRKIQKLEEERVRIYEMSDFVFE